MTVLYHPELIQGSEEWFEQRRGTLTASEMKLIITPAKLQYASNEKERTHLYELASQRITKFVEPHYIGDDMLRGMDDELDAKRYYEDNFSRVTDCGFIANDRWGFVLGYSPDGLVGEDGLIECKGRRAKFQLQTIIEDKVPEEYMIQLQTGLLVSERKWIDFISFCGGMPMYVVRVFHDDVIQKAIVEAAKIFHEKLDKMIATYNDRMKVGKWVQTERRITGDIIL